MLLALSASCTNTPAPSSETNVSAAARYLDSTGRPDRLSGGARMIPINTPKGTFNVWTKRVGNNPRIKVLLLHGGPGATHEYFEAADSFLPSAGVEYYYYDQLGSAYSDQPKDTSLWELPRFVEEVEQVRQALGLDKSNFYLLGHSWGGMLAIEYALKYQEHLKGLVISNMMASIPAYNEYAHEVLMPKMDQDALKEILALEKKKDFDNPRYEELLVTNYYTDHILRLAPDQWPEPVTRSFGKLNRQIYVMMQGPSEMGSSGTLERWSRVTDLPNITVPTLVIGAAHDTMDPGHMQMIADTLGKGRFLFCPSGSHMAMYDDQQRYFDGLTAFLRDVDTGAF